MNKRGLSPIIATVLLIAFAVAIGAMIMSWTSDVVKEAPTCADIPEEIINSNYFCRLTDQIIPRVTLDEEAKQYEVCNDKSITISQLDIC